VEASALQAPAALPQTRVALGTPLMRFRSDEQLVALFRSGDEEAFRAIHDRYRKRLLAYTRQMLPGRQDAEDAIQDVFIRAYAGLRTSNQELALRAWLFRVAHNRCIDELRRPAPPTPEVLQLVRGTVHDPLVEVDLRESLRRLIEDIRRLPEQQRSALLMRELAGMSYADLSASLGISVGAVKSLLVRARVALAQAAEARDTSCYLVREQLVEAHDRGIRPNANARKHMRDCVGCKSFRRELRGMSRQLAAVSPAVGPLGLLAKALGFSGGAGGGGGLALLGSGATASAGGLAVGINHVAALLVAAAATAGGAAVVQHTIAPLQHPAQAHAAAKPAHTDADPLYLRSPATGIQAIAGAVEATVSTAPKLAATAAAATANSVKAGALADPFGGGPVHAPVSRSSTPPRSSRAPVSSTSSSGATGTQDGPDATSKSESCSTPTVSSASPASTAPAGTSTGTPAASGAPASSTAVPCLTPTSPSSSATASSTSGSASTGSQTGGDTSGSSGTASGASDPSSSGSASSPSATSTSSSGGSTSASASK
jgi:RNA polymerase sigma factor (sigma-70 family)